MIRSAAADRRIPAIFLVAVLLLLAGCAARSGGGGLRLSITTVPTPPAYVSGGETLVRIDAPPGVDLEAIEVTIRGESVRSGFRPAPADPLGRPANALLGLVEGLPIGDSEIVVTDRGRRLATLVVTNYPITGPIFSGEHLEPYFCLEQLEPDSRAQPRRFAIGNGESLDGRALDEQCSLPTRVDFVYLTTGTPARFAPLPDIRRLPTDVATITGADGSRRPFVVRLETGTINRAIYQTAIVVDPANPSPSPWSPSTAWNGRLVYTFGGGCEAGFFQGTSTGGVLRESMLAAGYAVASSTLNVNAQGGCNDPLSAETAMMVKERFAETYGPPVHTIGSGGSGGAMQQLLIAGAYPGILDGIMPSLTFPDAVSYLIDSIECYPLRSYLNGRDLEDETRRRIGGFATWETCNRSLGNRPNRASPYDCPDVIPVGERYDVARRNGVRCSVYDGMRNVFGTRVYEEISREQRFGRSPHDNVGVQYGLEALNQGLITKETFLDLNENIGGWDIDFVARPERTVGDPAAIRIAYETGRVTSGSGGLATIPIIDERSYLDPTGDFHTSYYSFVMRERLIRDNGHADNYVIQRHPSSLSLADENLALMDRWLTNLALDPSAEPLARKVVRARPVELVDLCVDASGTRIREPQRFDPSRLFDNTAGRCNELFPIHAGPRMVAGGPLANDVLKCQLKRLDRRDYQLQFTDAEWNRLQRIFPDGVCDWSKPGVGQVAHSRTWISYGPSPVNRYRPR
jgi:hypothetical protein